MPEAAHPPYEDILTARATALTGAIANAAAQKVKQYRAEGRDIVDLTLGEPDFVTPDIVIEAGKAALDSGETHYTAVDGHPKLKKAIIGFFEREHGHTYTPAEIVVSSGTKHALFNCMMATVEPGCEVIVPEPAWPAYVQITRFAGGTPVTVTCGEETGFKITPDRLERAITPATRWLILNSPNNPTGAVYSKAELLALAKVLERHPQVWILADDIYGLINYVDGGVTAPAAALANLRHRMVTVTGVSKAHCMTGWRIGFAAGPAPVLRAMSKMQSQSTGCPSTVGQFAAIAALTLADAEVEEFRQTFEQRMRLIVGQLDTIPGLSCREPGGSFYAFPTCRALFGRKTPQGKVLETSEDVVSYFLENGVAGLAGTPYGAKDNLRFSFAAGEDQLRSACDRIRAACEVLK